jgi:undecaprenyl-diphosphatase
LDLALLRYIVQLRQPWLDDVMVTATALGGGGFIWIVIAAIAFVFPDRRAGAWRVMLTVWFTWFLVDGVIKPIVGRARPFDVVDGLTLLDQRPLTASFPSGHAAMAFAGALALGRLFPSARWLFWPMAMVIAFSRAYLAVHWPTDVLGGIVIGLASAYFVLAPSRLVSRRPVAA